MTPRGIIFMSLDKSAITLSHQILFSRGSNTVGSIYVRPPIKSKIDKEGNLLWVADSWKCLCERAILNLAVLWHHKSAHFRKTLTRSHGIFCLWVGGWAGPRSTATFMRPDRVHGNMIIWKLSEADPQCCWMYLPKQLTLYEHGHHNPLKDALTC